MAGPGIPLTVTDAAVALRAGLVTSVELTTGDAGSGGRA
jgi:hypothetical protein